MTELSRQAIQRYKDMYPPGTGICVDNMPDDPRPISSGTKGKVIAVDDIGTIHCAFENGRQLGLIPGVDSSLMNSSAKFRIQVCLMPNYINRLEMLLL